MDDTRLCWECDEPQARGSVFCAAHALADPIPRNLGCVDCDMVGGRCPAHSDVDLDAWPGILAAHESHQEWEREFDRTHKPPDFLVVRKGLL